MVDLERAAQDRTSARPPGTCARSSTSVPITRYVVTLDAGGELVVMQQNLSTSSMEALQVQGRAVRLVWQRKNNRPVEEAAGALEGSLDQEEGHA